MYKVQGAWLFMSRIACGKKLLHNSGCLSFDRVICLAERQQLEQFTSRLVKVPHTAKGLFPLSA